MKINPRTRFILLVCLPLAALMPANAASADSSEDPLIARGGYLVKIAGCNDCHTAGYMPSAGAIPQDLWLTGDSFGWRGPWGTTYAPNLRNLMQSLDEEQWLTMARALKTRPPMPWFTLNEMAADDLRGIYRFIRHLGPGGEAAPAFVPPDREPAPPYALFP